MEGRSIFQDINLVFRGGPDIVVVIATHYGLEGLVIRGVIEK